ncbi:cystatin-C-like [Rhinoraja longicauda]
MMAAGLWLPSLLAMVILTATADSMPGGISPLPVNDTGVVSAAQVAAEALNRQSNDLYRSDVARVVEASTQVVAGIMYRLKVELKSTTCRNTQGGRNIKNCPFHEPSLAKKKLCDFTVWS